MTNWGFSFFKEEETSKKPVKKLFCFKNRKKKRNTANCPVISMKYTCIPEIIPKVNVTKTMVVIPSAKGELSVSSGILELQIDDTICDFSNIPLFTNMWLSVILMHILFKLLFRASYYPVKNAPFVLKFIRTRRVLAVRHGSAVSSQTENNYSEKFTEVSISISEQETQSLIHSKDKDTQTVLYETGDVATSPAYHNIDQDTKFTQTSKPLPYNPLVDFNKASFLVDKKRQRNPSLGFTSSIHDKLESVWFSQYLQDKAKVLDGAPLGFALSFDRQL